MKKYLLGILAITMAVGFSAFTSKNALKLFNHSQYFYHPSSAKIFIGVTDPVNPLSLVQAEVTSGANWNSTSISFGVSNNLAHIEFIEEVDADGGNDGELTLQEAINELWAYYVNHSNTLPANGGTFTVTGGSGSTPSVVTVHRKEP